MKNLIIFSFLFTAVLFSCSNNKPANEVSKPVDTLQSKASSIRELVSLASVSGWAVNTFTNTTKSGIVYHIYTIGNGNEDGGMVIVNHTKDSLEIELLKRQLNSGPSSSSYTSTIITSPVVEQDGDYYTDEELEDLIEAGR